MSSEARLSSTSYARTKPTGGLELWAWVFMRVSGVVLLFLALGHLIIMHLINNVDEINYVFVANRYVGWFWRFYDLAMLSLAMIHGANGMRTIIDDHLFASRWRSASLGALYVICGGLLVLGCGVALFFQPMKF